MGRTTKRGDEPDMRTLDDPEPRPCAEIPAIDFHAHALRIGDDAIYPRRPNAWRRFWAWFLLGWTWEKLK